MPRQRKDKRYNPTTILRWGVVSLVCDLLSIVVIIGAVVIIALAAGGPSTTGTSLWILGAMFAVIAVVLLGVVSSCVVIYRGWAQIQTHPQAISPGRAVFYGFIPIVQLIWMYFAFGALAKRINEYMDARGIVGRRAGSGVCLAACICTSCSLVPWLGPLFGIAAFVLVLIGLASIAGASASIAENDPDPEQRALGVVLHADTPPLASPEPARQRVRPPKPERRKSRKARRNQPFDEPEKL